MNYYTIYEVYDRMILKNGGKFFAFKRSCWLNSPRICCSCYNAFALAGRRKTALIPRVLPWARSFCPFRACGGKGDYSIAAQTLRNQSSFLPLISAMDKFSLFTSSGSNS